MSINLRRLRAFVTVAKTHSVTEAARRLHLSPPAVTKSVHELEATLAVELLRRTGSGMQLTPAGDLFLLYAERALLEVEKGQEEVRLLMGGVGGRVMIGMTSEAAVHVMPMAVARLIQRRPQIEVSMDGGTFEQHQRDVKTGKLDVFLCVVPPQGIDNGLVAEPVYTTELKVVVRPGHPLAQRPALSLQDLTAYRWVQSSRSGLLDQLLRQCFVDAGLAFPENSIVIGPLSSLHSILRRTDLVAAAAGLRILEELERRQLVVLPISLPSTRHVVSLVRREDAYLSTWAKELIDELDVVVREMEAC
ncbi:MAG: LysR family transcriptional regulator [Xanthomonadaceae bacterium]|nr:LysR family transcriptional regulator [Xanthomonadaceae bacterium]